MDEANHGSLMERIIHWRLKHLSDRQMTLILSFFIGVLASIAGYVLHGIIHEIQQILSLGLRKPGFNWLFLLFPIVGIYLTSLFIRYVVRDNISHGGITRVLYAISTKRSKLRAHNCWSSVVASGVTIGFGGSVGAEAPIVLTGSAIGSNLGQLFRMDSRTLMLLVGCGASAASYSGSLQGSYSGAGLYAGGVDGQSFHGFIAPHIDILRHCHLRYLHLDG